MTTHFKVIMKDGRTPFAGHLWEYPPGTWTPRKRHLWMCRSGWHVYANETAIADILRGKNHGGGRDRAGIALLTRKALLWVAEVSGAEVRQPRRYNRFLGCMNPSKICASRMRLLKKFTGYIITKDGLTSFAFRDGEFVSEFNIKPVA